ncbi:MAG: hypothetical protein BRD55_02565 [Bacteroidetes bacterium SW_9_63_38]|nr:MAG: hypothetical protein BRD55_02565 [Bacteroidetes bacterium SW_9_63_38]
MWDCPALNLISPHRFPKPEGLLLCQFRLAFAHPQYSRISPDGCRSFTSESTTDRDHQDKLEAYLNLDSLQEYWIVSPSTPIITQYVRREDEWIVRSVAGRDVVLHRESLDLDLALNAVCDLVETAPDTSKLDSTSNDS